MALIECKNCGKTISDKAKVCPGCGIQLFQNIDELDSTPVEDNIRICEECGSTVPNDATTCPNCGCPMELVEDQPTQKEESIEQPQKVEITKVSVPGIKASTKKLIGIILGVIAIIAIIAVAISSSNAKKAKEDYLANLRLASSTMLSGAAEAESCGGLIHDVWYNCIFKNKDSSTDQYTRKNYGSGAFYDDFNDALRNLFSDVSFSLRIDGIKSNQDKVAKIMKSLKNPPDEYRDAYEAMKDFYDAYQELTECAVNPSGNLTSFTQTFNSADSNTLKYYKAAQMYLD